MGKNPSLSEQIEQYEDDRILLDPVLKEARQDRQQYKKLATAAGALANRTLEYVGPVDVPMLDCDIEMRKLAREVLALVGANQ